MKILYAALAAGNGHLSRAEELIPLLENYGKVDLAISGTDSQLKFAFKIAYSAHGLIFHLGKRGGIDYWRTLKDLKIATLYKDIKEFPVTDYDLIINDFEPITARAAKIKGVPVVSLSHQAAFLSENTPRPSRSVFNLPAELILRKYATCNKKIGLHFESYDSFIRTPVIKSKIRNLHASNAGHYLVYLPAYEDFYLANLLSTVCCKKWLIFSKRSEKIWRIGNVTVLPICSKLYSQALASCEGLLTGGGFESPAEAMHLGKKLMMIPQRGQFEQQANAAAAAKLGVRVIRELNTSKLSEVRDWINKDKAITLKFPDNAKLLIDEAVSMCANL